LSTRLRKYGVKPKVLRIGDATRRGYSAVDLDDAWRRYVLPTRQEAEQAQQRNMQQARTPSATEETAINSEKSRHVSDVADVALFPRRRRGVTLETNVADVDFEERAAILEYEGGLTRAEAEAQAAIEMPDLPAFLDRRRVQ
jgi:hypothetical protein